MERETERVKGRKKKWRGALKKIFKAEYFKKVKDTEDKMKLIHLVYIIG